MAHHAFPVRVHAVNAEFLHREEVIGGDAAIVDVHDFEPPVHPHAFVDLVRYDIVQDGGVVTLVFQLALRVGAALESILRSGNLGAQDDSVTVLARGELPRTIEVGPLGIQGREETG